MAYHDSEDYDNEDFDDEGFDVGEVLFAGFGHGRVQGLGFRVQEMRSGRPLRVIRC